MSFPVALQQDVTKAATLAAHCSRVCLLVNVLLPESSQPCQGRLDTLSGDFLMAAGTA